MQKEVGEHWANYPTLCEESTYAKLAVKIMINQGFLIDLLGIIFTNDG